MDPWLFAAVGVGIVSGAVLMVVMVQPGIDLLRALLGKDRLFGGEALNGCSTWSTGTLLCGFVVALTWRRLGFVSLVFVPTIAVAVTLFWTVVFYLKGAAMRRREFTVFNDSVPSKDGTPIAPAFAIKGGWYSQTGPGTGYSASVIQLGKGQDIIATNVFLDHELAVQEFDELMKVAGPQGCRSLDIRFVVPLENHTWQLVPLHATWTPLLCGCLKNVSDDDKQWWRQWCQPAFGPMGRKEVSSETVTERLARLVEAYPWLAKENPEDGPGHDNTPGLNFLMGTVRTRDNLLALRALLSRNETIEIVTRCTYERDVAETRGEHGVVGCSFDEDGVMQETINIYSH